jgi:DNA-binding beta-propeller fold protein YncE
MARWTWCANALAVAAVAAVAALLASCGSDPTEPRRVPAAIVIVPNAPSIPQKATRQLTATVVDAAGRAIDGEPVTFASTDTTILTVSASGLATSVGPVGTATIIGSDGELTGSIEATVTLLPSAITVDPNPLVLQAGFTNQLSVTVTDANGEPVLNPALTFVSSNPALVTVSAFGFVASVAGNGSATITVTSGTLVASVPVTVTQVPTSISVSPTQLVLSSGQSQPITVVVRDAIGSPIAGAPIAFASSDPAVVTVSNTGVATSAGPDGSATITITSGSLQAVLGVFVGDAPAGTVLATVPIGAGAWGVAVTAAGKYYVTTLNGLVFAGAFPTYGFPTSFSTQAQALSIAVNAAGTTAYVAQGSNGTDIGIAVVNLATNTVTAVIPIPNVTNLTVALSKDESTLFVGTDQGLQVVDVLSKTVVNPSLAVGSVNAISRDPSSTLLYATVFGGPILELDGATRTIARTLAATGFVQGTVASPDGTELYIADESDNLQVWDLSTNTLKQTLPGEGGFGIGLSPDGKFLYVTYGGQVRIVDRVSRTLLRTVTTGGGSRRVAFDPVSGTAIITNESGWVDFVK